MHSTEFTGPARYATLPPLLAWLNEQTRGTGMDDLQAKRLQLVLEELFANTINHGFHGESERPVRVDISFTPNAVILRYSDEAPPFDPTMQNPIAREEGRLGGFGLALVRSIARRTCYDHVAGRNVTELEIDFCRPV